MRAKIKEVDVYMTEIRKFKDLFKEELQQLEGEQRTIEEILDKPLIIRNAVFVDSFTYDGSKFAIIQASEVDGSDIFTFSCGGTLIMRYLKIAKEKGYFPFEATITKVKGKRNEYYVFE